MPSFEETTRRRSSLSRLHLQRNANRCVLLSTTRANWRRLHRRPHEPALCLRFLLRARLRSAVTTPAGRSHFIKQIRLSVRFEIITGTTLSKWPLVCAAPPGRMDHVSRQA